MLGKETEDTPPSSPLFHLPLFSSFWARSGLINLLIWASWSVVLSHWSKHLSLISTYVVSTQISYQWDVHHYWQAGTFAYFKHVIAAPTVVGGIGSFVPSFFSTPDMSKKWCRFCGAALCCLWIFPVWLAGCKPLWKWLRKVSSHKHEWIYHSKSLIVVGINVDLHILLSYCSDLGILRVLNCCRNLNWKIILTNTFYDKIVKSPLLIQKKLVLHVSQLALALPCRFDFVEMSLRWGS